MMNKIMSMYVTLMSPIWAGILNMIWCKSKILKKFESPIDGGKNFVDGKRIFGNNKTWKGLIGYVFFNILTAVCWGAICNIFKIEKYNFLYVNHNNTIIFNIIVGLTMGFAYSLFELPNSFLKRRIGIMPRKNK